MKAMNRLGQAEIMDGLILMLIAAICSVVLLSISSSYGTLAVKIYEETYAQKLAQNTLLSLYHITDQQQNSEFYRKSIMVAVSQELTKGNQNLRQEEEVGGAGGLISGVLQKYSDELGRNFLFALTDGAKMVPDSIISTDADVIDGDTFKQKAGASYCASAALTYQPGTSGCVGGNEAGTMCYQIFEVCTWLS
jgi:hypothetical protein